MLPQGVDRCYEEPHPAKQTMQLESSRAQGPRSSITAAFPTAPDPPFVPPPPRRHTLQAVASVHA